MRCSIYEHRPRTCRTYDCRIFPATGIAPDDGDDDKSRIADRARRWQFAFGTADGSAQHAAAEAAAQFLRDHRDELPLGMVPANPTQLAVLAIEVHDVFLPVDAGRGRAVASPSLEVVETAVRLRRPRDQV